MAESAHKYMIEKPFHKMVILAGNGHLKYKNGIPERLYRRNQEPYIVVIQDETLKKGIADYVLITTELEGKKTPVSGISINEKPNALIITKVHEESPADEAGLWEGDIILKVAGESIKSLVDLKMALFYLDIDSNISISIQRNNKIVIKQVELFPF